MTLTWQEFMVKRLSSQEENVPWFLHDKMKCYTFCEANDLATAVVLKQFESPADFDLSGLPEKFVVKPTGAHSTRGVLVLEKKGDLYQDKLRRRTLPLEQIVREQTEHFEKTEWDFNKIIVEEIIEDVDSSFEIPRDFKAYAFAGEVSLILEINRNTKPVSVAWFDGDFEPVVDDRVKSNEELATVVAAVKPAEWRELLDFARRVSRSVPSPFASIDMYLTPKGPIVGEITLAPGGIYYGKQFVLSEKQQAEMGMMWERAEERIRTASVS